MSIERNFYLAKILCYTVYPVCTCIYFEYGEPVFLYFLVFYIYVSIVVICPRDIHVKYVVISHILRCMASIAFKP